MRETELRGGVEGRDESLLVNTTIWLCVRVHHFTRREIPGFRDPIRTRINP